MLALARCQQIYLPPTWRQCPRILPAFFNVRRLWSPRLMTASLTLLHIGCAMRVASQVLAYQQLSAAAWRVLPVSAMVEMTAITLFAANMLLTLTTGSPTDAVRGLQSAPDATAL